MKNSLVRLILIVVMPLGYSAAAQAPPGEHFVGEVRLRGANWPAELDLERDGDSPMALLSLPEMGYYRVPCDVSQAADQALAVTFPFGLGTIALRREGNTLRFSRPTSDGSATLSVELQRQDDYRAPYSIDTQRFTSGDIQLDGWLYRPTGVAGPAVVIMLHGSAQEGRDSWEYRSWGDIYARMGHAVFLYDKRPRGRSRDLVDLAADGAAALAHVRTLSGVDTRRIGLAGGSQAAWLACAITAGNEHVAFLILSGWPAVNPRQQELQRIRHQMMASEQSADDIESALAYANLYFYVARTGDFWPQLQEATKVAEHSHWGEYVSTPVVVGDLSWWKRNHGFPAADHLRRVACPVLALYGAKDVIVPPAENTGLLRHYLAIADNDDVTIEVFDEADHRGEIPAGTFNGQFRFPQMAPGYYDTIAAWLDEHAPAPAPAPLTNTSP